MNPRILTLILLAIACGLAVTSLNDLTKEKIRENYEQFSLQQIARVVQDKGAVLEQIDAQRFLIKDEYGPNGMVFQVSTSSGYNGKITMWVATDGAGKIRGVRVIEHTETPGIGDLIERPVSDWIEQFSGMSLENSWNDDVDYVSGATITTRAVAKAVHAGLVK